MNEREEMLIRDKGKGSIILQVMVLFGLCVLLTGILTYVSEYLRAEDTVSKDISDRSAEIADEVIFSVKEYPAYEWLLGYWYEHWDELDIEYDAVFTGDSRTSDKCRVISEHNPDLQLRYADQSQIEQLSAEDQKLYAEIVYSWLITRVDQIKRAYNIDYLFCVRTEAPYDSQFFLFSGADEGAVRGTEYEQVYTLGVTVDVDTSQQEAMKSAVTDESFLADAGNYVDYYSYMGTYGGHDVLIGMTFNLQDVLSEVEKQRTSRAVAAMGYQVVLSLICALGILFLVLRPLKTVQENIRRYKDEKDSQAVKAELEQVKMNNEIGELATDVIDLSGEIDNYIARIEHITAERERVGAELSLAREIQASMLPHIFPPYPDRSEFDIYALMDPAREVGGDFYDFFMIDDDHLCLVIADVSGKGIPASLFMMMSRLVIKSYAVSGLRPSEILAKTNNVLCEDNHMEMFVTAWMGILEISTGILRASNAGHEYPVVKHQSGRFELYRDRHGFVMGGVEDLVYNDYEIALQPGAAVFVYTDGIPEATNKSNKMFGTDRMVNVLNEAPDSSPQVLIKNVRKAIDHFTLDANQFDDLTMLCVKYTGSK